MKTVLLLGLALAVGAAFVGCASYDGGGMMKCEGCKAECPKDKMCAKDAKCMKCDGCMSKCPGCMKDGKAMEMCPKDKKCKACDSCAK